MMIGEPIKCVMMNQIEFFKFYKQGIKTVFKTKIQILIDLFLFIILHLKILFFNNLIYFSTGNFKSLNN